MSALPSCLGEGHPAFISQVKVSVSRLLWKQQPGSLLPREWGGPGTLGLPFMFSHPPVSTPSPLTQLGDSPMGEPHPARANSNMRYNMPRV